MWRGLFVAAAVAWLSEAAPAAPPPADPALALQRQLDDALAAEASAPLILFIARYPDAPATAAARTRLATRRSPDPRPAAGPDGDIVAAFDRARLSGPAALDAFALGHANHPLGAEAARWSQWLRTGMPARPGAP